MKIKAKIIPGYGVASGKGKDERYPSGTLKQQAKYFFERGLDLSKYYMGTCNVDIAPFSYGIKKPKYFFEAIDWSEHIPPENFYFFDVSLEFNGETYQGLIYMPDPSTKEEHVQKPTVFELLLPKVNELEYEQLVIIEVNDDQLIINEDSK